VAGPSSWAQPMHRLHRPPRLPGVPAAISPCGWLAMCLHPTEYVGLPVRCLRSFHSAHEDRPRKNYHCGQRPPFVLPTSNPLRTTFHRPHRGSSPHPTWRQFTVSVPPDRSLPQKPLSFPNTSAIRRGLSTFHRACSTRGVVAGSARRTPRSIPTPQPLAPQQYTLQGWYLAPSACPNNSPNHLLSLFAQRHGQES
jgi:hypothetical protein